MLFHYVSWHYLIKKIIPAISKLNTLLAFLLLCLVSLCRMSLCRMSWRRQNGLASQKIVADSFYLNHLLGNEWLHAFWSKTIWTTGILPTHCSYVCSTHLWSCHFVNNIIILEVWKYYFNWFSISFSLMYFDSFYSGKEMQVVWRHKRQAAWNKALKNYCGSSM